MDGGLKLAAELARLNEAELVVLELEPPVDARDLFDPDGFRPPSSAVPRLEGEYPGLRLRARAVRGLPLATLCDAAEDERPDLIVVAHGGGRGGLLSAQASTALVERVPCAVLLVAA